MKLIFSLILIVSILACSEGGTDENEKIVKTSDKSDASNRITFKAIHLGELGWGYQIFRGSKIEINQEHIPAVNGLYGFDSKEKAEIAAKFVIEKMKEGWDRPTVKAEELDSIGAINLDSLNTISQKSMK